MTTKFELFPAIDLKDGACVRLIRGEMDQATVFNDDPGAQASQFQSFGFEWVHVVDLNGAFAGSSRNEGAVKSILKSVTIPVQLGGGLRDLDSIAAWLDAGVNRVILGTAAVKDPDLVKSAAKEHPRQIVVGIDAKDGYVATDGWAETSTLPVAELAKAFEDCGVAAIIFTDISRDGTKTGVNAKATQALADAVTIPVIASGGVRSSDDITILRKSVGQRKVAGAILGRALYDGDIQPTEALSLAEASV